MALILSAVKAMKGKQFEEKERHRHGKVGKLYKFRKLISLYIYAWFHKERSTTVKLCFVPGSHCVCVVVVISRGSVYYGL